MAFFQKKDKRKVMIDKELDLIGRKEQALAKKAVKSQTPGWKRTLEEKIPRKVFDGLNSAFCRGFSVIFEKGVKVIEKTYNADAIRDEHAIQDYAVQLKVKRSEIRKLRRRANSGKLGNLALTTAEGIGLGALGVGLPDIVVFIGIVLKGIYEMALRYGFDYDTPSERILILRMIEASLTKGEDFFLKNEDVDAMLLYLDIPTEEDIAEQIQATGEMLALDMLLLKFVQGLPIVGILGGIGNPVYYNKILNYVELKYRKRYLYGLYDRENVMLTYISKKRDEIT